MEIFRKFWLLALFFVLQVTAQETKEKKVQRMSTGETAAECIERKITTHEVSSLGDTPTARL